MPDERLERDRDLRRGGVVGQEVDPTLPRDADRCQAALVVEDHLTHGRPFRREGGCGREPDGEGTREGRCRTVDEFELPGPEAAAGLEPGELQRGDPAVSMGEPVAQRATGR
jgi:hypothetical protein